MHKIKEMLMKELKEYEKKGQLSAGDLETLHKLTDTVKNIDKIMMLEGGEGYSEDGMSYDGGRWEARGSYDGGSSYARGRRRAPRDSMGRYSGDDEYSEDGRSYRGSYDGYSREGFRDQMISKLEHMMKSAENEEQRKAIEHCIRKLESA